MFRRVDDFIAYWTEHVADTEKVFAQLTDASLNQAVDQGHRTLGRMAWHIVLTIPEMCSEMGLDLDGPKPGDPLPEDAGTLCRGYASVAHALTDRVKSGWSDATLEQEDQLYGETWKRGKTLWIIAAHEIHHRGQMTVLMRQAGLIVPGIYGPAQEEWPNYGMQEPSL